MSSALTTEKLFNAIIDRDYGEVEKLLQEGANPNRLMVNGVTPFHVAVGAASTSSYKYVELLLKFNGNPNVRATDGLTPLHVAAEWGKADCLGLLLRNGADVSLRNRDGKDVHWFAQGNENCKLILDEYIPDIKDCDMSNFGTSDQSTPQARHTSSNFASLSNLSNYEARNCCCGNGLPKHEQHKEISTTPKLDVASETTKTVLPSSAKREMSDYTLDATSPDHCVFTYKPKRNCSSEDDRSRLYDTVFINESEYITNENEKTVLVDTDSSNEFSKDDSDVFIMGADNDSCCSSTAVSTENLTTSCHMQKNSSSYMTPSSSTSETPKSTSSRNFMSEEDCRKMLMATRHNINTNTCEKDYTPHYESISVDDSIYTVADSTVPVDESLDINITNHDARDCQEENSNGIMTDDLTSPVRCDQPHVEDNDCLPQSDSCPGHVSQRSILESTSLFDHDHSKFFSNQNFDISQIKYGDQVFIHEDSDGNSLIEHICVPQIETSTQDKENSIPIKLSLSISPSDDSTIIYDWQSLDENESYEEVSSVYDEIRNLPSYIDNMADDELRQMLLKYGVTPGPIKHGRKQYKKRLYLLEQGRNISQSPKGVLFSHELRSVIHGSELPKSVISDDHSLRQQFDDPRASQNFRGGTAKDSFNYLLLDPRVTRDLPTRAKSLSEAESLKIFSGATFYVGKGKKSRPYAHFKEALRDKNSSSKKIQHIHDIWESNNGVISLHVFQNVVSSEAFTREAAMIDALGLDHLTNHVRGKCYGTAGAWDSPRVRAYGTFLLISAMQMLLLEGERQIRPHQVSNKRTNH